MRRLAATLYSISLGPAGFADNVNGTRTRMRITRLPRVTGCIWVSPIPGFDRSTTRTSIPHWQEGSSIHFLVGAAYLAETSHPFGPDVPLPGAGVPQVSLKQVGVRPDYPVS